MKKEQRDFSWVISLGKITGLILGMGFFIFFFNVVPAKADLTSFTAYYLVTSDTTPTIKGTVDDAGATITVTVDGHAYTAVIDGTTWSANVTDALAAPAIGEPSIFYFITASATLGGTTLPLAPFEGLVIEPSDFPFEFYFADIILEGEEGTVEVASITFIDEFTFTLDRFSLHFPSETEVTADGGITFDLMDWAMESINFDDADLIRIIQFGIPNLGLHFSHPVDISVDVDPSYNGRTLNIFTSESVGGDSTDWEIIGTCLVTDGNCSFSVNHASFFGISERDDLGDDSEKAHIDSWKAYQYEDASKNCSSRLKLVIKGKHFDKDATVEIGNHKASSVNKKSSKELVAKFCLEKIWNDKAGKKKTIEVTNPDADTEKADKKINLDDIGYDLSAEDFDTQTVEGIKNVQTALVELGLLEEKYITGVYGSITTEAVRKFQEQNGLPATGYCGPLTKAKLEDKVK